MQQVGFLIMPVQSSSQGLTISCFQLMTYSEITLGRWVSLLQLDYRYQAVPTGKAFSVSYLFNPAGKKAQPITLTMLNNIIGR